MRKRISLFVILILCLFLTACGHEHTWQAATCISPKICPDCGETEGEALGHDWIDATCTDAKVCSICLNTMGSPLGHSWEDATCTISKKCSTCDLEEGKPLGHTWVSASCIEPETCSVCSETQGDPLGHTVENWTTTKKPTCTETGLNTGICSVCNANVEQELPKAEHTPSNWIVTVQPTTSKDGTHVKNCTVCNKELEKETFTLSAEEIEKLYKSSCKSIPYDKLSRSPDDYEGELVKFSGRVLQVCSENALLSSYRVGVNGSYNNVVYLYVYSFQNSDRILEDDWISFYGEFDGLYTYTTVMGASVTIPSVVAEYVD